MTHTKGRWRVESFNIRISDTRYYLLNAHEGVPVNELRGNAALIAAAPMLLATLKDAEAFINGFEGDDSQEGLNELLGAIRTQINKAEGKN